MGKFIALLVASMGANVAIVARDPVKLEAAGEEIRNAMVGHSEISAMYKNNFADSIVASVGEIRA